MSAEIAYDPFSDAVMRDPWPFYAELRREAPVFYLEKYDTWFLSRFEDIRASTTNDVFSAERGVTPEMVILKQPPPPDPVFAMLDLPRQRDYRRIFVPRYTKRAVAGMEDSIRARTRKLLEPLVEARVALALPQAERHAYQVLAQVVVGRLGEEREATREHAVEQHTQGVHVASNIHRTTGSSRLRGAHVLGGSEPLSRGGA